MSAFHLWQTKATPMPLWKIYIICVYAAVHVSKRLCRKLVNYILYEYYQFNFHDGAWFSIVSNLVQSQSLLLFILTLHKRLHKMQDGRVTDSERSCALSKVKLWSNNWNRIKSQDFLILCSVLTLFISISRESPEVIVVPLKFTGVLPSVEQEFHPRVSYYKLQFSRESRAIW